MSVFTIPKQLDTLCLFSILLCLLSNGHPITSMPSLPVLHLHIFLSLLTGLFHVTSNLSKTPHCILHYQNQNWFKKEWMKETISPVLCEPFQCYELLAHSETLSKTVVITGMQDYKMPPPPTILIQHSSCSFGNVLSDLSRNKLLPGFKHMPTRWEADSALSQKGISGFGIILNFS